MNKFKESLKVETGNMKNIKVEKNSLKEQLEYEEYEEYKRKRFAKEVQKEKWENARKRIEKGEER